MGVGGGSVGLVEAELLFRQEGPTAQSGDERKGRTDEGEQTDDGEVEDDV